MNSISRPELHFHKLQGAGNDFVVLDTFSRPLPSSFDFSAAAIALCDRHFGVGADGLLTLESTKNEAQPASLHEPLRASLRMRMWNPDGSEDMCGNGLRCVAALAWRQKLVASPDFEVQTLAGTRRIEILQPDWIRAAMGEPIFEPSQIPIALPATKNEALDIQIPLEGRTFRASSLSTGSTHTVIFLDAPLSDADFRKFGPLLENHPYFPTRTSVMFATNDGENRFKIRIWERGAGETLACGTGACAVAVAAQITGRARGAIEIESRGGVLKVEWNPGKPIFLTGPARHVFEASGDFNF